MIYGTMSIYPCVVKATLETQDALSYKRKITDRDAPKSWAMSFYKVETSCYFNNGCWFLNIHQIL